MRRHWKKIALAALILALILAVRLTGLDGYLTLENLKHYRNDLEQFVARHYALSVLLYIGLYIVVAALSIPGAAILTLGGGFFFGYIGTAYVNAGATAGATMAFISARYLIGGLVQEKYGDRLAAFNAEMDRNGYNYLLTLRLIPVFPFFLINILAGITRVPLLTFIWTTAVGIVPGSFVYVYAGTQLGSIRGASDAMSLKVLSALVLLGVFSLVPVAVKKIRDRRRKAL